MQKILSPEPASIYINEEYTEGNNKEIVRDFDLDKAINSYDFNRYSKHSPLTAGFVFKP